MRTDTDELTPASVTTTIERACRALPDTSDVRLWVIADVVAAMTHAYGDPWCDDDLIQVYDTVDENHVAYSPSELVEHIYEVEWPTDYGPAFDQSLATALRDELAREQGAEAIVIDERTDADGLAVSIAQTDGAPLTEAQEDALGRALYRVLKTARALDDYEFTASTRVMGIRPDRLFLTREDAEGHLAHHHAYHSGLARARSVAVEVDPPLAELVCALRAIDWDASDIRLKTTV